MTIRSSLTFTYNGINSAEFGIINVNIGDGMLSEPFVANRSIKELKVRGRPLPYFQEIEEEPLQFEISFAFENRFDAELIRSVARWLTSPKYYAPLIFSDMPERVFYCLVVESPTLIHNALNEGYVTLTFRCNSPYSYSQIIRSNIYNYSDNTPDGTDFTFMNAGDLPLRPLINVEVIEGDRFAIVNESNSAQKFELNNLVAGEKLVIDCQQEDITTDIPLTYRYKDLSEDSEFLEMVYGANFLKIYGRVKLQWVYQYIFLQG